MACGGLVESLSSRYFQLGATQRVLASQNPLVSCSLLWSCCLQTGLPFLDFPNGSQIVLQGVQES
jgi:hypothetical protein